MKRNIPLRLIALPLMACIGLAPLGISSAGPQTDERRSATAASDPARKIDPELTLDLQKIEVGALPEGMRVVVELETPPSATRFANAVSLDPVQEVADAVLSRQLEFLDALNAEPDLVGQGSVEVLDFLTLQYSVVLQIGTREGLQRLSQRADVKFIRKDHLNLLYSNEGRTLTGSDTAAANGDDGSGVGVAVIDSSFDLLHPELGGSTSLPNSVVSGGQNFSDPGTSIHSRNFNDCYHGTGTASIVKRYAPGVDLYLATVFPNAYDSVIANSINWCITNKNGMNGGAPIRVISMSLGGGRYYSECNSGTMHNAASDALSNGILVFAASGNDGWQDSMGSPACSSNVISIGSVWDQNGAPYSAFPPAYCNDSSRLVNERTCYSDTASFLDLYAPSEEVICARCGGGTFALGGTSSACPAAAGLTAQLLDANSSLVGDMSGVVSLYQSTGVTVIGDSSKRRIDLTAAIGDGGGGGGSSELSDDVPVSFSVSTGSTLSYTIEIPANASNLNVAITGSGDADLYVKRASINWPSDQGSHNESEFKAPYVGGSSEAVDFSSPAEDTWNVLIHGYSGNPAGTITASWDVAGTGGGGGPVALADGVAANYSVATGATTAFTIPVPSGATSLAVSMTGNGDADLYVKRASISWPGDQGSHDEAEFKAPYIGGSAESVDFTNPAADTWNVLIHGYSGNPTGTITANWEVASSNPQWNYESYVKQSPHNYSNNSTYTFTYEYPGASQVAVHFQTLNTEANYDFIKVYDASNTLVFNVSGNLISGGSGSAFDRSDGWIVVSGSKCRVELVTDYSVTRYGYLTDQAAAYY
jgi:hypothetical protein